MNFEKTVQNAASALLKGDWVAYQRYLRSVPLVSKERAEPTWWIGFGCCHKLDLIPCFFSRT